MQLVIVVAAADAARMSVPVHAHRQELANPTESPAAHGKGRQATRAIFAADGHEASAATDADRKHEVDEAPEVHHVKIIRHVEVAIRPLAHNLN